MAARYYKPLSKPLIDREWSLNMQQSLSSIVSPTEIAEFKQLIDDYYAAWSLALSGNDLSALDSPAPFYAKGEGLVFYDPLPPLEGHHGWEKFKFDVVKVWREAGIVTADIRRTGEPQVWRQDNLAWAAVLHQATATLKNGQSQTVEQRQTFVWQQQDSQWSIVHEHASAAVSLGSNLQQHNGTTPKGHEIAEFSQLVREFWSAWNTQNSEIAACFYVKTPDLVVYLPWRTQDFIGWDAFKQFADKVMQDMQTVQFTPDDNVHILRFGDIAVTAGIFSVMMRDKNGTMTRGDARYTLIWANRNGKWLIVHEHLSAVLPTQK